MAHPSSRADNRLLPRSRRDSFRIALMPTRCHCVMRHPHYVESSCMCMCLSLIPHLKGFRLSISCGISESFLRGLTDDPLIRSLLVSHFDNKPGFIALGLSSAIQRPHKQFCQETDYLSGNKHNGYPPFSARVELSEDCRRRLRTCSFQRLFAPG